MVGPRKFSFLGIEGELAELCWQGPGAEKLWRYNQHYFDDLNALGASQRRSWHAALIEHWLAGNPPGAGDGWEPYPTSLRICNWLKASVSGLDLPPAAWHSLAVQARWLTKRLEWHLLGNHLFVNAKALVLSGLAFEGDEAAAWLELGMSILREQLPEQVLPDGGQFERSPMYHALALEDLLDLINAAQAAGAFEVANELSGWREAAARMLHWLRVMSHPDGRLARFNDSAHGIAPANSELERYAAALGVESRMTGTLTSLLTNNGSTVGQGPATATALHLPDSGYIRATWCAAVALLDVAPVGPDYLPGHAHADTLSFELSIHGQLLVVNGGTSCYGMSVRRHQERGTAAHSTLQIAGNDSSEVWGGFRVGRRARPLDVQVGTTLVRASHDGYVWLPDRPLHTRTWQFFDDGLDVGDVVTTDRLPAVARFHLAPGLTLQPGSPQVWEVMTATGTCAQVEVLQGQGSVHLSTFAPEFGVVLPIQCLAVECKGGRSQTRWTWRGKSLD